MAHPMAAAVALSALGFGLAGQAFGAWLGAMAGLAEASRRAMVPMPAPVPGPGEGTDGLGGAYGLRTGDRQPGEPVPAVSPSLMPEDFRQPKPVDRPASPDNLKAISGIGPKLEAVLNRLGVWTFAQIEGWTREEIAWMDDYLGFNGRIGRDDWIGQARNIVAAAGPQGTRT